MDKKQVQIKAFTLIELLVVVAITILLGGIILIALNPGRQIKKANNAQRSADINTLTKALMQYQLDNDGNFDGLGISDCPINDNIGSGDMNLAEALVPLYVADIPIDPEDGCNGIDTCYDVCISNANRPVVSAPNSTSK